MNWNEVSFDWNQARAFLATAETGSLSAAARALRLTQPTLSRQVAALEEKLGVTLFERVGKTLVLTDAGLDLLDHVKAMGEAAGRVSLAASGQSQAIEGKVRITGSDQLCAFFLPPILKRIRREAPGIRIEVVVANDLRDLRHREADIAIRHVEPTQPDLIAKRGKDRTGHFYAMSAYLDRVGRPKTVEELSQMDFIGYDDIPRMIEYLGRLGLSLTERNFVVTASDGIVVHKLLQEEFGVTALSQQLADMTPGLEAILPDQIAVPIPVWLVTHRELHTSRRIRVVFDLLAEALG